MSKVSLFISDLTIGGAERVAVNLAKGFISLDYDVDIVLVHKEGKFLEDVPESVNIIELDVSRIRWCPLALAKYLRKERPKALISFMTGANVMAVLANKLVGSPCKVIVTEHNTQTEKTSKSVRRDILLGKISYRFADNIVGVSSGVVNDVAEWSGIDNKKIYKIYNPSINENFIHKNREKPEHPWFNSPEVPVILGAGRHTEQKNFKILLKGFSMFLSRCDGRLVLLGEGELTDEYIELSETLGISDKVHMPGFVEDPYPYIQHSNVFVLSSKWEGLSLVLIEAMGCGTPVVSTDCPNGPAEVLKNGKYGPLVPVGDPEALSDAIYDVLENPPEKEFLKERAKDFTIDKITKEYEKLI